jgi:TRAP-type C4-dicarboxylate transport system substrate-binding protein
MSRLTRLGLIVVAASALAVTLSATPAPLAIWSLATIAPANSPWSNSLLDMNAAIAKDTAGRVKITVFPGGKLGGEPSVVRQMRAGQVEISLLMLTGLAQIDDGFNALGVPFFFKDDAEAQAVRDDLTPRLEKRICWPGPMADGCSCSPRNRSRRSTTSRRPSCGRAMAM